MSRHLSSERLSVYLDDELDDRQAQALESHLAECEECQVRFKRLRSVVGRVQELHRPTRPRMLDQLVLDRVSRERRPVGLVERIESRLGRRPNLESYIHIGFALVFAMAVILYFFAHAVERQRQESARRLLAPPAGSVSWTVGGRTFDRTEHGWRQRGVAPEAQGVEIDLSSPLGQEVLRSNPWIGVLLDDAERVVMELDGTIRILYRGPGESDL